MSAILLEQHSTPDLQRFTQNFINDLQDSANGKLTDFSYLKTSIFSQKPLIQDPSIFQVMTVGGTNFLSALALFKDRELVFSNQQKFLLPQFLNSQIFLDFVLNHLQPEIQTLAINYGYPIRSFQRQGRLDGVLLRGTKDHVFTGLVRQEVGQVLEDYIFQKTGRHIQITLANDIVCLLASQDSKASVSACINGTGFNLGFLNQNSDFINLESGNFKGFRQTDTGQKVDAMSSNPGSQLFEKEVSGAYLYRHYNIITQKYGWQSIQSTAALDEISRDPGLPQSDIAQKIFQRSAALVACQIAGLYRFLGQGGLTVMMEGGVYWKVYRYPEYLEHYLDLLGVDLTKIEIMRMENPFVGVARLVL
jgi:hexokinase